MLSENSRHDSHVSRCVANQAFDERSSERSSSESPAPEATRSAPESALGLANAISRRARSWTSLLLAAFFIAELLLPTARVRSGRDIFWISLFLKERPPRSRS